MNKLILHDSRSSFLKKEHFSRKGQVYFLLILNREIVLFYSRRIGLNGGEQVPIYGGARITGMIGKWDIGFLDMQTQAINQGEGELNSLSSKILEYFV